MVKRGLIALFLGLFLISMVSSLACVLDVSLINQDPYPAIPGDYVKVVFQIDGISNPECGIVTFEVKEDFPISLDKSSVNPVVIKSGVYDRKYSSFYIAPYKLIVDNDALDGDNPIEVSIKSGKTETITLKEFSLDVEDSRVDFEIFVKDYDLTTKIMTLEILNIGKKDIEALTIEIPKQDHIEIKGANRNIVGDLDSNEYTTAEFEATSDGGNIDLEISYTDTINVRRSLSKTIIFTPEYFEDRNGSSKSPIGTYVIIAVLVIVGIWWWRRRKKRHARHAQR